MRHSCDAAETEISAFDRNLTSVAVKMFSHFIISLNLNSVNQLIFVMVKCGVLFEVRTGFLNNI
jgi:hypothetical protein